MCGRRLLERRWKLLSMHPGLVDIRAARGTLADLLRPREPRTLADLLRPQTHDLFAGEVRLRYFK